jgi:CRISPR system Cascade subunit CasA
LFCHSDVNNVRWQLSLPRDDFELACLQLLVCLAQILFLPQDKRVLREKHKTPLSSKEYLDAIAPVKHWFDLDHPEIPFMQTRGVKAVEATPIQKLLIGLPEGNNHAFFNEAGEVKILGSTCSVIALFNQASNCPSFGGGFKGSLRGAAPVTTLVIGDGLRDTIWRNVLTLERVREFLPGYELDFTQDKPIWVDPVKRGETINTGDIGLIRGLFWQPAHVELIPSSENEPCDLLGSGSGPTYSGFKAEKFSFTVNGFWEHPHGAMTASFKKGKLERKFISFTTTAPAWTQLTEFVVPSPWNEEKKEGGSSPAAPVVQAAQIFEGELHLLVGGYRNKQASVLERRHEMMSLACGWADDRGRVKQLVELGKKAKTALWGQLYYAVKGNKKRDLKGIGANIHEIGERLFFNRTEPYLHEALQDEMTFKEFKQARESLAKKLAGTCKEIFEQLTDPYAMKPELIPIIAIARRTLDGEFKNLI